MAFPIDIFVVRHGEAAARWHEAADPGLSVAGHAQAQAVCDELSGYGPLQIISSPLRRAQETAAPLAARWGIEAMIDPRFREVPGPSDLAVRPTWIAALMTAEWSTLDSNVQAWRATAWSALRDCQASCVIFTHFMLINALVSAVHDTQPAVAFEPDYCSVTQLQLNESGVAVRALGRARTSVVL
jgi:broad specificity phosphatase PhoE